jgi:hypothetical protein
MSIRTEIALTLHVMHPDTVPDIHKRLAELARDYVAHPNVDTVNLTVDVYPRTEEA